MNQKKLKKSITKKTTFKKYTPQKYTPKKYTPKKYTPKKYTPKKWTPKKWTPKKWTPKKWNQKKWIPKKWNQKKWTPKKWTPRKWYKKKWTPKKWYKKKLDSKKWSKKKWNQKKYKHKRIFYTFRQRKLYFKKIKRKQVNQRKWSQKKYNKKVFIIKKNGLNLYINHNSFFFIDNKNRNIKSKFISLKIKKKLFKNYDLNKFLKLNYKKKKRNDSKVKNKLINKYFNKLAFKNNFSFKVKKQYWYKTKQTTFIIFSLLGSKKKKIINPKLRIWAHKKKRNTKHSNYKLEKYRPILLPFNYNKESLIKNFSVYNQSNKSVNLLNYKLLVCGLKKTKKKTRKKKRINLKAKRLKAKRLKAKRLNAKKIKNLKLVKFYENERNYIFNKKFFSILRNNKKNLFIIKPFLFKMALNYSVKKIIKKWFKLNYKTEKINYRWLNLGWMEHIVKRRLKKTKKKLLCNLKKIKEIKLFKFNASIINCYLNNFISCCYLESKKKTFFNFTFSIENKKIKDKNYKNFSKFYKLFNNLYYDHESPLSSLRLYFQFFLYLLNSNYNQNIKLKKFNYYNWKFFNLPFKHEYNNNKIELYKVLPIFNKLKTIIEKKLIYYFNYNNNFQKKINLNYYFFWKYISYSIYLFYSKFYKQEKLEKKIKKNPLYNYIYNKQIKIKEIKKLFISTKNNLNLKIYNLKKYNFYFEKTIFLNLNINKKNNLYLSLDSFFKLNSFLGKKTKHWMGVSFYYCSFIFMPKNKVVLNSSVTIYVLRKVLSFLFMSSQQGSNYWFIYQNFKLKKKFLNKFNYFFISKWKSGYITNIKEIHKNRIKKIKRIESKKKNNFIFKKITNQNKLLSKKALDLNLNLKGLKCNLKDFELGLKLTWRKKRVRLHRVVFKTIRLYLNNESLKKDGIYNLMNKMLELLKSHYKKCLKVWIIFSILNKLNFYSKINLFNLSQNLMITKKIYFNKSKELVKAKQKKIIKQVRVKPKKIKNIEQALYFFKQKNILSVNFKSEQLEETVKKNNNFLTLKKPSFKEIFPKLKKMKKKTTHKLVKKFAKYYFYYKKYDINLNKILYPTCALVLTPSFSGSSIHELSLSNICLISLLNSDFINMGITYPIPSNDYSNANNSFFFYLFMLSIKKGNNLRITSYYKALLKI